MAERPILFQGVMVRALPAGTKTQTRRAVKGVALDWLAPGMFTPEYVALPENHLCPYGVSGDLLWVRETYFAFGRWETRFSEKKGRDEWHFIDMTLETDHSYCYAADGCEPALLGRRRSAGVTPAWWKRPAIFMPRDACRIVLEITDVRVERLQAISNLDAMDEGIEPCGGPLSNEWRNYLNPVEFCLTARASYQTLWDSINGAGSWDANPWVWCVEFQRVTP